MKQGTFLVVDNFDSMRKITINQLKQLGAGKIVEADNLTLSVSCCLNASRT